MTAQYDTIVIGAGANGLVAAAALGRAGQRVLLLEGSDSVAGVAGVLEFAPGFRASPLGHDAGWVPPVVLRGLGLSELARVHVEVPLSVAMGPSAFLSLPGNAARAADEIRRHSPKDAAKWPAFTAQLRKLASFLEALYQLPAPDLDTTSVREAWPLLGLGRKFRSLGRADMTEFLRVMPMSVQQLTEDWFELETLRAAIAACGVQDYRQGPISGGTGFVLLHHLVGAAEGSMRRAPWRAGSATFASIAENTARQHGVTIRTGADVASISVRDDVVTGVVLRNGEELHAQRVLSSLDPARTLLGLVDPVWLDPEVLLALRNIRYRGCTAYVLFALDELPAVPGLARADDVLRGTLSCSPDVMSLERAADAGKYGRMPDMPHVEITAPSLHWPDLAPAGKHVVLARAQYASYRLRGGATWDAVRSDALADSVTALIDAVIPCFSARVLQRTTLTPRDLEERFGLTEGAITHGELALDQILFMRPIAGFGQYAMPIDGLYLCGAGTHPGPGVTGGPGWLAAQRVLADSRK